MIRSSSSRPQQLLCTCLSKKQRAPSRRRTYAREAPSVPLPTRPPPQALSYRAPLPTGFGVNQLNGIQTSDNALTDELRDVLATFRAPVRYALAYGSGVFKQAGYSNQVRGHYMRYGVTCLRCWICRRSPCWTSCLLSVILRIGTTSILPNIRVIMR